MEKSKVSKLFITSSGFKEGENIPALYTCEGKGINPLIRMVGIPVTTQSLAIIMEDPDTSKGTFDHWLVWNIPPAAMIPENSNPGINGKNSGGKTGYHPPCPPTGSHRYIFSVYALDKTLELEAGANKKELQEAMADHIIAKGTLMGKYEKQKKKVTR